MFFERYLKDPLMYAASDFKKIFVGGVLQLVCVFAIFFGMIAMFASFVPVMMDIAPELAIFASLTGILIGFLISSFGVLVLAIVSGYYVKIIENTLNGDSKLPEWDNFKELLKKGAYFLTGMFILQVIFGIISLIISSPFLIMSFINESYLNSIIIETALNLISFAVSIVQALYLTLALINYVDKNKFGGFFDVKEIFSKMSIEYVLVLVAVAVVSFILVIPVILVLMVPIIVGAIASNVFLALAVLLMILVMPFLQMFLTAFGYRSYTNYFLTKK